MFYQIFKNTYFGTFDIMSKVFFLFNYLTFQHFDFEPTCWSLFQKRVIMAISFSGGRSRSNWREPPTMGKQLVNFITCGCESSAISLILLGFLIDVTRSKWYAILKPSFDDGNVISPAVFEIQRLLIIYPNYCIKYMEINLEAVNRRQTIQ
jgi:hypothetical protein